MKSTAGGEGKELQAEGAAPPDEAEERSSAEGNISSLRELTFKLLHKVQSISEIHAPSIESGLDFYDEVTRFEIDLIKRALIRTGGHQRRAARLLNLKVTTLNSKIKHYNIRLVGGVDDYPVVETDDLEGRRRA